MTTAAPSTALVTIQPAFTDPERLALAGFLAGYRGLTREAYALDLRQFTSWCRTRPVAASPTRGRLTDSLYPKNASIDCFFSRNSPGTHTARPDRRLDDRRVAGGTRETGVAF